MYTRFKFETMDTLSMMKQNWANENTRGACLGDVHNIITMRSSVHELGKFASCSIEKHELSCLMQLFVLEIQL